MAHELSERTAQNTSPAPSNTGQARRRLDPVGALTAVVVAVAVVVRVAFLANQSYWGDEVFSVRQASATLGHVVSVGRTEIHTPLYALLLWCWERLGGSTTLWTHSLSALFGLGAIVASYTGLRGSGLSDRARMLAVALTAGSGFGIVYAQESRPYALVLLGATGLTAATVRQVAVLTGTVAAPAHPRRRMAVWGAWALLTATAHLLGAALVGVLALVLAVVALRRRRTRDGLLPLGLAALALVPQAAWVLDGMGRPGFAQGTTWIRAPGSGDVRTLLATVFAAARLTPLPDGFAWTSVVGVAVVVVLLLVAVALRLTGRWRGGTPGATEGEPDGGPDDGPDDGPDSDPDDGPGAAAATDLRFGLGLLGVAALVLAGVYLVAQVVHIWTLRNMIIVVPALTWGVAWVVTSLPPREVQRRILAVVVLVATLASVVSVGNELRHPYKTDWRGLIRYLAQERAAQPTALYSYFGGSPLGLVVAADRGHVPDPYLARIDSRSETYPRSRAAIANLKRAEGPQVVVYYNGIRNGQADEIYRAIRNRLADPSCTRVPIYGLVVVSCP